MPSAFSDIFIVTYGRTGSTLLQALLNTDERARIEGENFGFFYHLYSAIQALKAARFHLGEGTEDNTAHPFFCATAPHRKHLEAELFETARRFLRRGGDDAAIRGFKEIRYDLPDLADYLDFLRRLSSAAFFVFLIRAHDEVVASGFMRQLNAAETRSRLAAIERDFAAFATRYPESSAVLDYRDIIEDGERLRNLFQRLGLAYDAERVAAVLGRQHSYNVKSALLFSGNRLQLAPKADLETHFTMCRFDRPLLSDGNSVTLGGVLLPKQETAAVALYGSLMGGSEKIMGVTGLASHGLAKTYPDDARAARARFSLSIPRDRSVRSIIAALDGQTIELARFYPALDGKQSDLFPITARTGEAME